MSAPTALDAASRTMAKPKKWIKSAIKRPGAFRAKAEAAGESTRAFAEEKKDAPGRTGRQARLALSLMGMTKSGRAKHSLYKD